MGIMIKMNEHKQVKLCLKCLTPLTSDEDKECFGKLCAKCIIKNGMVTISQKRLNDLLHVQFPKVLKLARELRAEIEGLRWEMITLVENKKNDE